jgi:hypothetical protein
MKKLASQSLLFVMYELYPLQKRTTALVFEFAIFGFSHLQVYSIAPRGERRYFSFLYTSPIILGLSDTLLSPSKKKKKKDNLRITVKNVVKNARGRRIFPRPSICAFY